jgi:hypothetical protein
VTVAEADPVLPRESTAVKTTTVAPIGNSDGALLVTETAPSTASVAVAAARNAAMSALLAGVTPALIASTVISAGALTVGPAVSFVAEAVTVLVSPGDVPTAVTVTVPSGRALASAVAVHALSVQVAAADEAEAEPPVSVTTTDTSDVLQVPETL